MRVFKDLGLVEQLGTGVARILKTYSKDVFEFYPNFIRININFKTSNNPLNDIRNDTNDTRNETLNDTKKETLNLTEIQRQILQLMIKNPKITQKGLAEALNVARLTITRQMKVLKPTIIELLNDTRNETLNDTRNETINLTETQKQILQLIKKNPYITQTELLTSLDVVRSTITRHIKILVELKIIERVGPKKRTLWKVNEEIVII